MPHEDIYISGKKLVSVTQLPAVVAKIYLDKWRIKLCHCKTHVNTVKKTPFKDSERIVIDKIGVGHCGFVYGEQIKEDAAELGTEVHDLVDGWFKGRDKVGSDEARKWADRIICIYKEHQVKPHIVSPEETLIDAESGLNGSIDHTILWEGRPELADLKFKNQLDDFTGVQGWLYRYLIKRKYNVDFRWMRVMWGKKQSKNREVEPVLIDLDLWRVPTLACVTIWNVLNPKRQVKIIE